MKKFLVIQTAFLGDVILATPVVAELARLYPGAVIDVLVRKGNESLLANHPSVRKVMVFDKKSGKIKSMRKLIKQNRKEKYDEVINLQRFASSGLIAVCSGAASVVGFDKNPLAFLYSRKVSHTMEGLHEVERNLLCIAHHDGVQRIRRPELFPSEENRKKVASYITAATEGYYCLAPASVWYTKQLPVDKWIELAVILSRTGKRLYFIGGSGDFALCQEIIERAGIENGENLAGKLNLLESAALIEKAKRSYVNDSGPMHICSAMNAPVTAFYCSTIPAFGFGPLSEDAEILETPLPLLCRPCGFHGHRACPKGDFECGYTIPLIVQK